jgi:signal peptidase I
MKAIVRDILLALLLALAISLLIRPTIVKEISMVPTLDENNYLMVAKQSYRFGDVERDDIIVFHSNLMDDEGKEKLLIKRIIGIPGDVLTISDGNVYRNGNRILEPYIMGGIKGKTNGSLYNYVVPENFVFVMGDNREVSLDSRSEEVGPVRISDIIGKAFFKLYPFDEIGGI